MKIGFIVNPIAGMGGKVGLKGTDHVFKEAVKRGAKPVAPGKAMEFLQKLKQNIGNVKVEVLTCPLLMGEDESKAASFSTETLPMNLETNTTAEDTKNAVKLLTAKKVDLIVFVGGDGTAKDIHDAMQGSGAIPVLGIPSGVKMYSGVFAVNVADAVEVVLAFVRKEAETAEFEIMDADEDGVRSDVFAVRLHGFLKTPFVPMHVQGSKQVSPETIDEKDNQVAIARFVIEELQPNATLILGPGTTIKCVAEQLGIDKTLLGVDIYAKGEVFLDVNEKKILSIVKDWNNTWILLSPIGHQGILLGRGNQQISSEVVKHVGKERIIVAATKSKLQSIEGSILRVDTGDAEVDNMLKGYIRVVTDYREWRLVQVQ
jgi:predicted polyphosphate/ATP-dependent NAD kinase